MAMTDEVNVKVITSRQRIRWLYNMYLEISSHKRKNIFDTDSLLVHDNILPLREDVCSMRAEACGNRCPWSSLWV